MNTPPLNSGKLGYQIAPNSMNSPVHPQIQRTLAAIVVTDAVGFSKRMSQDEDKALAMINRDLQLITELCEFFEGKILKTVGDGVLMYFVSAVQAVACAIELQKTFLGFHTSNSQEEHFTHRVGVHLGDIFFNQTDMMGTGVNIAARLESEAKPGAICMSQVVYDVVKSRLELDADYLGELTLKNIAETVAAYNVWPKGMRPASADEDVTEAVASLVMTPLNAAVRKLSAHPNHRRIKKLLYGTHQTLWENDPVVLEGFAIKTLLESLTDRNSSLEGCRHSLYAIVSTLNRQKEYSKIADIILESLHDFYAELTSGTLSSSGQVVDNETTEANSEDSEEESALLANPILALYTDVAIRLEATADPMRTKKLLYCLCYDSWENNGTCLQSIDMLTLIQGMCQHITSSQALHERLKIILQRLNRRAKYAPIANTIFKECKILYPDTDSQISMPGPMDDDDVSTENTQINLRKKSDKRWVAPQEAAQQPLAAPVLVRSAAFGN